MCPPACLAAAHPAEAGTFAPTPNPHPHPHTTPYLQHVFLQHKVVAPRLRHVLLHGAAGRAIVVEARHGAVDFEGGDEEKAALQRIELRQGRGEQASISRSRRCAGTRAEPSSAGAPVCDRPTDPPWPLGRLPCSPQLSCRWHPHKPACEPVVTRSHSAAHRAPSAAQATMDASSGHLLLLLQVNLQVFELIDGLVYGTLQLGRCVSGQRTQKWRSCAAFSGCCRPGETSAPLTPHRSQ